MDELSRQVSYLRGFSEQELTRQVVIPLLRRMGLVDIMEHHGGSAEKGKDVVCHYTDILGARRYVAVVMKKTDIHGSVGKTGNASEVLYQVEQALNEPFSDVYELAPVEVSECWVITSGLIKNTAIESIRGKLSHTHLDKLTQFFDGPKLASLIARHWPEFWHYDRILLQLTHDMSGSIVGIRSIAQLLIHYPRHMDETRVRNSLKHIVATTDELFHIVDTATYLSMREIPLELSAVRIQQWLRSQVPLIADRFQGTFLFQLQLNTDSIPDSGEVHINEHALRHVLYHIIANAMIYKDDGDANLEIFAKLVKNRVVIFIRDFGIGVPEGLEEQIFQEGFCAPNAIEKVGPRAGIGLSISRRLIRRHGGELRLTNRSQPTEFAIYLPMRMTK